MNGRIYDPRLACFMQADPLIQAATNTQSQSAQLRQTSAPTSETVLPLGKALAAGYSGAISKVSNAVQGNTGRLDCARLPELGAHYSYVWNNPLNKIDPSGYAVFTLAVGAFLMAAGASVHLAVVFTMMAFAGMLDALHAGATFQDAFRSGIISGLSAVAFTYIGRHFAAKGAQNAANSSQTAAAGADWGGSMYTNFGGNTLTGSQVAQQISAHAAVGGITAVAQGGKFGHGFLSAGITKGITGAVHGGPVAVRLSASMAIGGTVSKISGGKFANGAKTAAFQFMFNEMSSAAIRSAHEHGVPINQVEREALAKKDLQTYYQSRFNRGDSYGAVGLGFWDPDNPDALLPTLSSLSSRRLLLIALVRSDHLTISSTPEDRWMFLRTVGVDLANRHAKSVADDFKNSIGSVRGVLSIDQLTDIHHDSFENLGLPKTAYGGTPSGNRFEAHFIMPMLFDGYDQ